MRNRVTPRKEEAEKLIAVVKKWREAQPKETQIDFGPPYRGCEECRSYIAMVRGQRDRAVKKLATSGYLTKPQALCLLALVHKALASRPTPTKKLMLGRLVDVLLGFVTG